MERGEMWERAESDVAVAVREFGEALGEDRDRMRRSLCDIRQTMAGGRKLIAETVAMIAVADALATTYWRQGTTIEASKSAPVGSGHPLVKARPAIRVATPSNGPIAARAAFEWEVLEGQNLMPDPDTLLRLQQISTLPIHEGDNGRLYERLLNAAIGLMSADMGSMQVFHPERGELRLLAERGFHPESASYWQWVRLASGSTCGMALSAGCRVVVPDIETCEAMAGTGDLTAYRRSGIRAVQSTPLVARSGRLLGMISTHWRKPHRPTERELLPLDVLARQAADLIERNEVEAALRESREQLRWLAAIVQSCDDAIFSTDLDGIITSWNAGAERLYGYSAEEVIGKPLTILIPRERQDEEVTIIGRVRRGDHIEHYETIRRRRDGKLLDVSLTVSPVKDAEGDVIGASKIARDITERKQKLESLRRQADLLDQSHDAIFTWKIGGGIVYWSKGAERLYGYTAEETIGRVSHELLRTRSPIPMQEVESQIAREGSWYGELTHTTRDGRAVVVESRHVRVQYGGKAYALETNRDITERKAHEEHVHLLMREVNHRAKNMLSVVSAIAYRTAAKNPRDFVERFSQRIQALSANQDLLIRNDWKGADVEDLVRAQLAHFASIIGTRITVHGPKLHLKPESAQAIGLALHELATNAGKYGALSTNEGRVDVRWLAAAKMFTISWTENDGPPVIAPTRRGFGSTVIDTMAKYSLAGEVAIYYARSGLMWQLTCPAANALEPTA
jgi:PAS domain S-box-containing protein